MSKKRLYVTIKTNFKLAEVSAFRMCLFCFIFVILDDGAISYDELRNFYAHFIKLPDDQVEPITTAAYTALTSVRTIMIILIPARQNDITQLETLYFSYDTLPCIIPNSPYRKKHDFYNKHYYQYCIKTVNSM